MTKQRYIALLQSPLQLLYEYYKETNKYPILPQGDFMKGIQLLCFQKGATVDELFTHICKAIERELKIWRVYDKDKKFINFA